MAIYNAKKVVVSKQLADLLGWNAGQANTFDRVMDGVRYYINAKKLLYFGANGAVLVSVDGTLGEVCNAPFVSTKRLEVEVRKHTKPESAKGTI